MPTVSVVIPTYNRKNFLLACLDSVAKQTCKPDEVIIVDDGSSDGTLEALADRSDLQVVQQRNFGPGAARNLGAAQAASDYIAFLDSDDLWYPWTLQETKVLLKKYQPSLLYAKFEDFTEAPAADRKPLEAEFFQRYLDTAGQSIFAGAGMMFVKNDEFVKVGGFSEDRLNAEDHDFALRMGVATGFVQINAPCTLAHRVHAGNEMKNQQANLAGLHRIVKRECEGMYPGGIEYRTRRRKIISDHLRPAMIRLAGSDLNKEVWPIWKRTALWGGNARRIPYLVYTLIALAGSSLRSLTEKSLRRFYKHHD